MPIIKASDKTFTPAPAGTFPARCYSMISLGTQPAGNPQYKPSFQVLLQFELPTEMIEVNGQPMPLGISKFLNAYLGSPKKPSQTNQFLQAWRGRPFTAQELLGFDLKAVVGAPCLLNIIHTEKSDGSMREQIASISPMPKGMVMPAQVNRKVIYEIEQGRDAVFQSFPEWIQKKIEACEEFHKPVAAVPEREFDGDTGVAVDDVAF